MDVDGSSARVFFSQNVYLYSEEPNIYFNAHRILGDLSFTVKYFEPITPEALQKLDILLDQIAKSQYIPIDFFAGGKLLYTEKKRIFDI